MLQVIFVDSCYFCAFDVLEMLVHSNANLVCAMDMVRSPSGIAIAIASHRTATTHRNRGHACCSSHAVHVRCPLDAVRLVHAARHFSGVRARRTHARTHARRCTRHMRRNPNAVASRSRWCVLWVVSSGSAGFPLLCALL